ncbi:MAG TPA: hypothetical protein VH854_10350 [Thermoanaerobaculia bacterium]|jgi:hypothetical protein|nr:hypothetical protein [Thermoanaerobaculia bacterium]
MKRTLTVGALCAAGAFGLATASLAQDSAINQSTTTQSTTTTTTRPVQGKVVRYEAGKSIVVVGADGRMQTFPLTATVSVPSDVAVGRTVSIVTEPSSSGAAVVSRITTTSVSSDGSMKTETQTHVTDPEANSVSNPSGADESSAAPMSSQSSQSTTTTSQSTTMTNGADITGTVTAYEPGKSVTFVLPDKRTVVYTIDASSVVPSDVAVGKTYTVTTIKSTKQGDQMVVKKITTTRTTTTNP